ncbi:MAG: ABC transporter ATP-binding protein [Bacteroidales bacterium]|nr:ABC transporter ATP-binding protein [Bacteroidales bacterium]
MISVSNLYKSYGEVSVLNGVDLKINTNEIVSIVGKSGAGKTTLLQILGTLLKPDSGEIVFDNQDISKLSSNELAQFRNKKIGFIFQFYQLLPEFTALENVCIPALIGKTEKSKAEKRAKELLDFLNLGHRIGHKPNQLSGGEQQRVAVARALINSPSVIFADEPSGNLDTKNKKELHELFFKLRDTFNQTFIIVTHDMNLAETADKMITMEDGKIL